MIPELKIFLHGVCAMGALVAGLFFFRFYSRTKDRLFVFFALAFFALGVNWTGLALTNPDVEARHWFFVLRLGAFLLLLYGIVDKNRGKG